MNLDHDIEREARQWQRNLKRTLRPWSKTFLRRSQKVLTWCQEHETPLAQVFALLENMKRVNDAILKRESETGPLLNLLSDRKKLNRKAATFKRGAKGQQFLPEFVSYFGLSSDGEIAKVTDAVSRLHVAGKRRPKEHRTTLLILFAANFFLKRTGQPQWERVRDLLYGAFPELGRIKSNTIEKRLENLRRSASGTVRVPPTHNLSRNQARKWVAILMDQASQDVLAMELEDFNRKRKQRPETNSKTQQTPTPSIDAMRDAYTAWVRFFRFANRPALTSGEQARIERLMRLIGEGRINRGWQLVERWRNWADAKEIWISIWRGHQAACERIIESLT